MKAVGSLFVVLMTLADPAVAADRALCRDSKQVVDACFTVHGRLWQSNGDPSMRIWIVGTRRMLGVFDANGKDESPTAVPRNVKKLGGEYVSTPVFGDYEVCPLTKARPGWMQMVCIESGTQLMVKKSN